jgi:quercetin dioxygenase-like cupin family protein
MPTPQSRLREAPVDRFAGSERHIVLSEALAALRAEARETIQGHRQVTLLHGPTLRLVLFAFDAGGRLLIDDAPGSMTLQGVSGSFRVRTLDQVYELSGGHLLLLDAGVSIDIEALAAADLLLGISMHEEEREQPEHSGSIAAR